MSASVSTLFGCSGRSKRQPGCQGRLLCAGTSSGRQSQREPERQRFPKTPRTSTSRRQTRHRTPRSTKPPATDATSSVPQRRESRLHSAIETSTGQRGSKQAVLPRSMPRRALIRSIETVHCARGLHLSLPRNQDRWILARSICRASLTTSRSRAGTGSRVPYKLNSRQP